MTPRVTTDYSNTVDVNAPPGRVFDTLTTAAAFASWWAPATGSADRQGGELRLDFGFEDPLVMLVEKTTRPSELTWKVTSCNFLPEWVGTTLTFTLTPTDDGRSHVEFGHVGLSPQLECFEMCRAGWDQYVPSLCDYIQSGVGNPYTQ